MFLHSFKNYLTRFRWEITGFWLVSAAATASLAFNASMTTTTALGRLEIVAGLWVTLRLMLAETNLLVSGGWRARPFGRFSLPGVQGSVLLFVIAGCLLFRGLLLQRLFAPDAGHWMTVLTTSWIPGVLVWLALALLIRFIGGLILGHARRGGKILVGGTLALLLLPLLGLLWSLSNRFSGDGGSAPPGQFSQDIQRQLTDARDFVGRWNDPLFPPDKLQPARLVMRIPLDAGAKPGIPGTAILAREIRIEGSRVAVSIRLAHLDPEFAARLIRNNRREDPLLPVLRYADGTYGACEEYNRGGSSECLAFVRASEFGFDGSFVSPLSLPEYEGDGRELLQGAELLWFEADPLRPARDAAPAAPRIAKGNAERETLPQPPAASDTAALAAYTRKVVDQLELYSSGEARKLPNNLVLPREAFAPMLATRPWGDHAWDGFVRPYLIRTVVETDKPALLEILKTDPRMAVVFHAKGWAADALPELKRILHDRLPLDEQSVVALASERDPAFTADLFEVALRIGRMLEPGKLETALKQQPGFDWHAYVLQGWHRRKYAIEPDNKSLFAAWAAREGDASAFRHLAETAARDAKWERQQLASLVATDSTDLIGFLRANIGRLRFDPATQRFLLP